ncbi:MAG: hypothetical protein ABW005_09645 [Burkholderiaceae bacterium]
MHSEPSSSGAPFGRFSSQDEQALLQQAASLRVAAQRRERRRPLQGRCLGLMGSGDEQALQVFRQAALELGAHVATLSAQLDEHSSPEQIAAIGRMLGRLYDAVECQGMSPALVSQLAAATSVPVYAGLASGEHRLAGLAADWPLAVPLDDKRRWLIQAALLSSLA